MGNLEMRGEGESGRGRENKMEYPQARGRSQEMLKKTKLICIDIQVSSNQLESMPEQIHHQGFNSFYTGSWVHTRPFVDSFYPLN